MTPHLVSSNSSINVACFILAIVFSVLLWLTASDYPFGIFKLFYQCGMFYFSHSQRRTDNTMAKIKHATLIEEFEDTKWVIWSCKSKKDRQHNSQNLQTLLSMWHVLFWPSCFLSFFDLQLQITHLVSSNSTQ
jgi:hypothetical protein